MLGRKERDQLELLITGSLRQLLPDDHILARVDRVLDLSWLRDEVADLYCSDNGRPGIDPEVAVRLMLAGFLLGLVHDRRLMREAHVNIAIRWFVGYGLHEVLPDHSSLTRIRQRWGAERFRREHGADRRGDEMPDWMADKQRRFEAIGPAKAALEAEAADPPDPKDESGPGASSEMRWQGRVLRGADGGPPDRAQKNFTNPDSRILPTRDGFVQGYNGQIAVDATHQVIVAHRLVTTAADYRGLAPLLDDVQAHLGRKPREVSGDAGFATETNLAALEQRRIKGYLAPGRARHGEAHAAGRRKLTKRPLMSAMAERLRRAGRRSRYRLRKQVVEPVFGQVKHARGFRQFLLRGLDQVRGEWAMICTAHNLLKLAMARG